jgi:nitrogen fixation protein FixH
MATLAAACGGGEPPADQAAPAASAPAAGESQGATITFASEPASPKVGENTFDVTVTDQNGQPVTDAEVSVEFHMAAMPSMNMPEMRNRVDLMHAEGGRYRGTGNVVMGGAWDVTVTARRGGEEIGRRTLEVTAQQ